MLAAREERNLREDGQGILHTLSPSCSPSSRYTEREGWIERVKERKKREKGIEGER